MPRAAKCLYEGAHPPPCWRPPGRPLLLAFWPSSISKVHRHRAVAQGQEIKYTITAGHCVYGSSGGSVTCTQPSVTVAKLPAFCNLAFTSAATVTVRACSKHEAWLQLMGGGASSICCSPARLPSACVHQQACCICIASTSHMSL